MNNAQTEREARVLELTQIIRGASRELETLTAGELDAFTDDTGRPWLLRPAQERLLDSEAALRRLAQTLEDERARLLAAQRVARLGSWETIPQTLTTIWSEETHRIFETNPNTFQPTHAAFLERVHPEDRVRVDAAFASSLTQPGQCVIEHRVVFPNGAVKVVEERWETIFDAKGLAQRVIGTCQDITERVRAEESLRASQSLLRFAGHAARLGGWMLELPDKLTWSDEVCEIHDLPRGRQPTLEESMGFYLPENRAEIGALVGRCAAEGVPFDVEMAMKTATGRDIWVRALGEAGRDAQGRIVRVQGGVQDITERKLAQQELHRINRALRMLSDSNAALVRATGEQQLLEQVCRIVVEVGGYRMSWVGYPQDDPARTIAPQAFAGHDEGYLSQLQVSWSAEVREGLGPAGTTIRKGEVTVSRDLANDPTFVWREEALKRGYRSVVCLPLRDKDHTFGLLGLYSSELSGSQAHELRLLQELADDLAFGIVNLRRRRQQMQAEQQLAQQAALLDHATDAIFVLDLQRRVTFWNQGAQRLFGAPPRESIGAPIELLFTDGNARHLVAESMAAVLAAGAWAGEVHRRTHEGRALTVQARWTLLREPSGAPRAVLAIETDVTEKKKLENQFLRAQRMESIGTLAGGIAHDLNNVLTPILMSVEVLKSAINDPNDLEVVEMLQRSARRGADLVKQVLTFARGVEGQRVAVQPLVVLKEIEGIVRDTFPKNVVCELRGARGCWPVSGDPTQLQQVFMNLVVNARDAMVAGGRLTLSLENVQLDEVFAETNPDAQPGDYVLACVGDTGAGIAPELHELIFEPFFTTKALGHGTGLGLSTTQAIVKSHGGFLTLSSEPERGTIFKVYLPALKLAQAAAEPLSESALPRGAGELVLVVDDEVAVRHVARRTLEKYGYRVVAASNGAEGVAAFARQSKEIALVVTDMSMPIMDGAAMVAALRTIDPRVRVIGSSGLRATGPGRAFEEELTFFIPKPYTAGTLIEAVHLALHPRG